MEGKTKGGQAQTAQRAGQHKNFSWKCHYWILRHKLILMLLSEHDQSGRLFSCRCWLDANKSILSLGTFFFINNTMKKKSKKLTENENISRYWLPHKAALKVKCCVFVQRDIYSRQLISWRSKKIRAFNRYNRRRRCALLLLSGFSQNVKYVAPRRVRKTFRTAKQQKKCQSNSIAKYFAN